ncbi:MAG TPA: YbaB/EbfC family nucleoid-associated protein [Natronosporangium sp.]
MDEVAEFLAKAEQQRQAILEVQQRIERMEVTGRSRNSVVVAKVRGSGQLTEVTLDARQLPRYDAKVLGGFVVEAVNDAMARLAEASREAFAPFIAEAEEAAEAAEALP